MNKTKISKDEIDEVLNKLKALVPSQKRSRKGEKPLRVKNPANELDQQKIADAQAKRERKAALRIAQAKRTGLL